MVIDGHILMVGASGPTERESQYGMYRDCRR